MQAFEDVGFSLEECETLNLGQLHQHIVFESDIFNADGITVDARFLHPCPHGQKWSRLRFSTQRPPLSAFHLWQQAIGQLTPGGQQLSRIGKFVMCGHKVWEWRFDPNINSVFKSTSTGTLLFSKTNTTQQAPQSV